MNLSDQPLRSQLVKLLEGGNAHATLESAVGGLPEKYRGKRPPGLPYSVWELVEHIRISQHDILEFSRNAAYKSIHWPDDYWPKQQGPLNQKAWDDAIEQINHDRNAFLSLILNPEADLYKPFAHGDGQNLLREALLIADHTSYHVGQIIVIRRLIGQWK